jgi:hypothetical protein
LAFTNPQQTDFQNFFQRDFMYSSDPTQGVTNVDIANAFARVNVEINQNLFPDQATYTMGYYYLTAHYLVLAIRASTQGLNGQYNWAQNNKSVMGVSESFEIPERIKNHPKFMMLSKTNYGAAYLDLLLPFLVGQIGIAYGTTSP